MLHQKDIVKIEHWPHLVIFRMGISSISVSTVKRKTIEKISVSYVAHEQGKQRSYFLCLVDSKYVLYKVHVCVCQVYVCMCAHVSLCIFACEYVYTHIYDHVYVCSDYL